MGQAKGRTQPCSDADARQRRDHARAFLDVAELTSDEDDPDLEYAGTSASLAVLAGIAASDAACCKTHGERSRSDNHHDAEALVEQVRPGGDQAAKQLRQLLNLKDTAHYGLISISRPELKRALRQAKSLVDFADDVLSR